MQRRHMPVRLSLNRRDVREIVDPGLRGACPDLSLGAQLVLLRVGPNSDTKQFFGAFWWVSIGGGVNAIASLRQNICARGLPYSTIFTHFLRVLEFSQKAVSCTCKGALWGASDMR